MTGPAATPPSDSGRPRWSRPVWWAVAVVLVVVAVVTVVVLNKPGSGPAGARRKPSNSASPSVTASACAPRVTEAGFANRYGFRSGQQVAPEDGAISFGVILENPCPQPLVAHASLFVTAVDGAGAELARYTWPLPSVASGQHLGVGGTIDNPGHTLTDRARAQSGFDATAVARIVAVVRGVRWSRPEQSNDRTGRVITQTTVGQRGQDGVAPVTFTFDQNETTEARWCAVIFRDAGGTILSGALAQGERVQVAAGGGVTMRAETWVPAAPSAVRAEVYFLTST